MKHLTFYIFQGNNIFNTILIHLISLLHIVISCTLKSSHVLREILSSAKFQVWPVNQRRNFNSIGTAIFLLFSLKKIERKL